MPQILINIHNIQYLKNTTRVDCKGFDPEYHLMVSALTAVGSRTSSIGDFISLPNGAPHLHRQQISLGVMDKYFTLYYTFLRKEIWLKYRI